MSQSVSDLILEKLTPIYGIPTTQGPDAGSVQELLKRWWAGEGNAGLPTNQKLFDRYTAASAVGASLQDKAYDFWSRGLLKSGVRLPGTAGNYISTPDSVLNSITGDIDIRVLVKLDDWTPAVDGTFVSKWQTSNFTFQFGINTAGSIRFAGSINGTVAYVDTVKVPSGLIDGQAAWLRVTHDVDNGTGSAETKFYQSSDGITWTQFGITTTTSGVWSLFDGTAPIEIGSRLAGTQNLFAGTIYYAEVRNGIDGPIVAKFDSSQVQKTGAALPASVDGWTWNGSALSKRDDYVRIPGTATTFLSYPDTVANSVLGDLDLRWRGSLDDWTPASTQCLISKENPSTQRSYFMYVDSTGPSGSLQLRLSVNGSSIASAQSSVAVPFADGVVGWCRATWRQSDGRVQFFTSLDGVTWTQLGSDQSIAIASIFDSSSLLTIGARGNTGSNDQLTGNVYYAEVRNGIGGTVVAYFDGKDNMIQTPWTINGSGWSWEASNFVNKPSTALQITGASSYASTPDTVGNSVIGDIDIRAKVALDNWANGATQALVAKWVTGGNNRNYQLSISSTGVPFMGLSLDGSTQLTATASVSPGFVNGTAYWIRVTRVSASGVVTFYTSSDGIVWTPLGTTISTTAGAMADGTAAVEIGSRESGANNLTGKIYYAEVRNGIDGPIVVKFNATNVVKTGTRTPTTTAQPGGSPNLLTPNDASMETSVAGYVTNSASSTLAQNAVEFLDGTKSLEVTSTIAGTTGVRGTGSVTPVIPGKAYIPTAWTKAATVGRSSRIYMNWLTSAGAYISSTINNSVLNTTTGWTANAGPAAVAPPTAGYVNIVIEWLSAGIGEIHYVDRASIVEAPTPWTLNGSAWDWALAA